MTKYPKKAKVACLAGAVAAYGAVKSIIDVYAPGYTDSFGLNPQREIKRFMIKV